MQPEPLSAQDTTSSELLPVVEGVSIEATPIPELAKLEASSIQEKKSSKRNIAAIVLGILASILLLAAVGLGVWGYILNVKLNDAQQRLTTLEGEHTQLQTDYATLTSEKEKLNTDLTQSKTDLEKANADLAATQLELKKSQNQNKSLKAQIDKASKFAAVLYSWFTSNNPNDMFRIDSQIKAADDSKLLSLWRKLTEAPSEEKFSELLIYLVTALRDGLK